MDDLLKSNFINWGCLYISIHMLLKDHQIPVALHFKKFGCHLKISRDIVINQRHR